MKPMPRGFGVAAVKKLMSACDIFGGTAFCPIAKCGGAKTLLGRFFDGCQGCPLQNKGGESCEGGGSQSPR